MKIFKRSEDIIVYFVALRYCTGCSRVIVFPCDHFGIQMNFFSSYVIVKSCFSANGDTEQIDKNLHTLVFSYVLFSKSLPKEKKVKS